MKAYSRHRDICVKYNAIRESWFANLRLLGVVPERPHFNTKAEATKAAKAVFNR